MKQKLPTYEMPSNFSDNVHFLPWVGCNYHRDGLAGKKILILGESHYTKKFMDAEREITKNHTRHIVQVWALDRTARFYTITRKLLVKSIQMNCINYNIGKNDFWNTVSFYNYIQDFVGNKSRIRPKENQWNEAKKPFIDVISKLSPDMCVVLGKELWSHVSKYLQKSDEYQHKFLEIGGKKVFFANTAHPSSGISYKEYVPKISKLFMS